jgi:hypothetical protein
MCAVLYIKHVVYFLINNFERIDIFQMSNQDSISSKDRKSESNYNHVRKII